jgi:two-component system, OmpR family, sensor kinase
MRRWFAGTRARLTLVHAVVLAAAILLADLVLYAALSGAEGSAADDVLRSQASTIAAGIEDVNGQVRFGGGDLPTESQQGVAVDAAIVAADGSIVQTPAQPLASSTLAQVAAKARAQASPILLSVQDSRGAPRHVYAERLDTGQGSSAVLIVSRSVGELQAGLGRTVLFLGVVSALLVVAGAFLAHWLTGRVLLPVRRITSMARSLSEHDLHQRVDLAVPPDELGELVETFNGMLARLESSFESLRRFTADASHELRSPLTLMRSELEGTLARARTPAEYRTVLRGLEDEVERMARMVDQLLILARADAGALQPEITRLDVADFLHETAARWRPVAERRDVRLEVEAPDSGEVSADPDLLRRVVDNLLDNAIRHTPANATVHLVGSREPGDWRVEVSDEGPGIPQADQQALFRRFARLDSSRGRDSGGAGLGLALSRAIAESHGGSLELSRSDDTGATFRLSLPDRGGPSFRKPLAGDARLEGVPKISARRP